MNAGNLDTKDLNAAAWSEYNQLPKDQKKVIKRIMRKFGGTSFNVSTLKKLLRICYNLTELIAI